MNVQNIAVCGLGYVGLPVAVALAQHFNVMGFDVDTERISHLRDFNDWTGEVSQEILAHSTLQLTDKLKILKISIFLSSQYQPQ